MYTAFIVDVFARAIVGWKVSNRMNTDMVMAALTQAITDRNNPKDVIHDRDILGAVQTDKKQLMQIITATCETGVGIDNEEFIPGMVACAVIIPNGDQQAFATIFTHGPTVRKSLEELLSYVPLMQEAANELSVIFNQNYE